MSNSKDDPTAIPMPTFEHLKDIYKTDKKKEIIKKEDKPLEKHSRAYDAYCRWMALPKKMRKPKTVSAFETKWRLPARYSARFKKRRDFRRRQLTYFWDWMMDQYPDVVYGQYRKAIDENDTNAAKFFSEILSDKIDVEKPSRKMPSFVLVGIDQKKIDNLFRPQGIEEADLIPEDEEPRDDSDRTDP